MAATKSSKARTSAQTSKKKASRSKAVANRKNAARSTGPKTETGKAVVAMNSLVHGLRSPKPVLAGVESESEWQGHRRRLVRQMEPEGALESALAERIALGFWRLARCTAIESRVLLALQEKGRLRALSSALTEERMMRCDRASEVVLAELRSERDRLVVITELWEALSTKSTGRITDPVAVDRLIDSVCDEHRWSELGDAFNEAFSWPPKSLKELRAMVDWLLERVSDSPGHAFVELREQALATAKALDDRVGRIEAAAERGAELAIVESDSLDKLLRYETTIHRALSRDLHELQRFQAMRLGRNVAIPIALDVNSDPCPQS